MSSTLFCRVQGNLGFAGQIMRERRSGCVDSNGSLPSGCFARRAAREFVKELSDLLQRSAE